MSGLDVERTHEPFRLFGLSPLRRLAGRVSLRRWRLGAVSLVAIGWLPLLLLSSLEGRALSGPWPFLNDYAVHARLLVELPLLVASRRLSDALFGNAVEYLLATGAVSDDRRAALAAHADRIARVRDSWVAAAVVVLLAYASTLWELEYAFGASDRWRSIVDDRTVSLAGVWYYAVARPLVMTQLLRWVLAFALSAWLFVGLARLPVRTMPFHPDGAAGLRPLMTAHATFLVLGFALSTDLAGALANRLVHAGETLTAYRTTLVAFVVVTSLVLVAPLLVLGRVVLPSRMQALLAYGRMAFALGRDIERRGEEARRAGFSGDTCSLISAHCDSATGLRIVGHTSPLFVTRPYVLAFVVATALPLGLATLTQVPITTILAQLRKLTALG
jgi:hypothetical protein